MQPLQFSSCVFVVVGIVTFTARAVNDEVDVNGEVGGDADTDTDLEAGLGCTVTVKTGPWTLKCGGGG